MRIIAALAFLISFQAVAAPDWGAVEVDMIQNKPGKLLDKEKVVIHYKKCRAERVFEWKDVEHKENKNISNWMVEVVKDMDESGKCG